MKNKTEIETNGNEHMLKESNCECRYKRIANSRNIVNFIFAFILSHHLILLLSAAYSAPLGRCLLVSCPVSVDVLSFFAYFFLFSFSPFFLSNFFFRFLFHLFHCIVISFGRNSEKELNKKKAMQISSTRKAKKKLK